MSPVAMRSRPCILVVEDNTQMREMICALVRSWDMECLTADNGRMGYRLTLDEGPDLVITDLIMPDGDGFEFLTRLSEMHAEQKPPVIVLSGSLQEACRSTHHLLRSASYLLNKPLDPVCLFDCISRLLRTA